MRFVDISKLILYFSKIYESLDFSSVCSVNSLTVGEERLEDVDGTEIVALVLNALFNLKLIKNEKSSNNIC